MVVIIGIYKLTYFNTSTVCVISVCVGDTFYGLFSVLFQQS